MVLSSDPLASRDSAFVATLVRVSAVFSLLSPVAYPFCPFFSFPPSERQQTASEYDDHYYILITFCTQ